MVQDLQEAGKIQHEIPLNRMCTDLLLILGGLIKAQVVSLLDL